MRQIIIRLDKERESEKTLFNKKEKELKILPLKYEIKNLKIIMRSKIGYTKRHTIQNTYSVITFDNIDNFDCFWFEHEFSDTIYFIEVNLK